MTLSAEIPTASAPRHTRHRAGRKAGRPVRTLRPCDGVLGTDDAVAAKDRLYRALDKALEHKEALERHLAQRWRDLFGAKCDLRRDALEADCGVCRQSAKLFHSRRAISASSATLANA